MSDISYKPEQLLDLLLANFGLLVQEQVKILLENKHLYQSIRIDHKVLDEDLKKHYKIDQKSIESYESCIYDEWFPSNPSNHRPPSYRTEKMPSFVHFDMPDVKLYCQKCKRKEAFNIIATENFLQQNIFTPFKDIKKHTIQVFAVSLLCQSCKSLPEVFLIRREDMKLIICGRAPIEEVEVPKDIPKIITKYYSDAVVAYQSGQTLAGNFLLRTLIEQWSLEKVQNSKLRADEIIDKYMESLPDNFNRQFKSMREIYGKLSEDIHKAVGSSELFEEAKEVIIEHFEARRLFKLS